jgi:hypothetical protein
MRACLIRKKLIDLRRPSRLCLRTICRDTRRMGDYRSGCDAFDMAARPNSYSIPIYEYEANCRCTFNRAAHRIANRCLIDASGPGVCLAPNRREEFAGEFDVSARREFRFSDRHIHFRIEFLSDRLEFFWDELGLGVDRGGKPYRRSELDPKLYETVEVPRASEKNARFPGLYVLLALFSYALLPLPWVYATYVFLALFAASAIVAILGLRKKFWIQVYKSSGGVAISVNATKWSESEREKFKRSYADWMGVLGFQDANSSDNLTKPQNT